MKGLKLEVSPWAAIVYSLLYFFDNDGWFASALPAVVFHEAGHALAIILFGGQIHTVRLDLAGLCLESTLTGHRRKQIICLLAGPCAGFLWTGLAFCIPREFFLKSAQVGLVIDLFNLLPVWPLDGGHILRLLLGAGTARSCSLFLCVLLTAASLYGKKARLLLPFLILLCINLPTKQCAGEGEPVSPAGTPAPEKRIGSWLCRIGSGRDKNERK